MTCHAGVRFYLTNRCNHLSSRHNDKTNAYHVLSNTGRKLHVLAGIM